MPKIERIAILGANSQIAQDYIKLSLENNKRKVYLFSRNPMALQDLMGSKWASRLKSLGYDRFGLDSYDLIINFVGGSNPAWISMMGKDIFTITDHYDDLVISYLKKSDQCKYIFISSGAAYGDVFGDNPASELTKSNFDLKNLATADYYGASKYIAEQRHRALSAFNIIDIRIFSYISKRQNLDSKLFLPQAITAIINKTEFLTSDEEMWRDYLGPEDFFQFLECAINSIKFNDAFDCFSCSPVSKLRLLEMLVQEFGLKVLMSKSAMKKIDPKKWYYSDNKRAEANGYHPKYDSMDSIRKTVISLI